MAYTTEDIIDAVVAVGIRNTDSMLGIPKTTRHRKVIVTYPTSFYEKKPDIFTILHCKDLEQCFSC